MQNMSVIEQLEAAALTKGWRVPEGRVANTGSKSGGGGGGSKRHSYLDSSAGPPGPPSGNQKGGGAKTGKVGGANTGLAGLQTITMSIGPQGGSTTGSGGGACLCQHRIAQPLPRATHPPCALRF